MTTKERPAAWAGLDFERMRADAQVEYYHIIDDFGPVADTMNCHHCLTIEEQRSYAALFAAAPDLVNGINALLGLLQLMSHNQDVPESVREMMRNNHRIDEARAALARSKK